MVIYLEEVSREDFGHMKIIAHRGFSGKYPENTLLAFEKAVEASCDAIELDVQMTKDGTLVLFHDDSFERLVRKKGFLQDHNWTDLETYHIRKKRFRRTVSAPMVTLETYFIWVKDQDILTVIELKNNLRPYTGMEEKLMDLVKKYHLEEKIIFCSFQKHSLQKLKAICPDIPCGFLTKISRGEDFSWIQDHGIEFIHPKVTSLWPWNIHKLRKLGVKISPWTVNHPLFMWYLLKIPNLYGIITDRPDRLHRIRKLNEKSR